jgi:hypothetical protein
MPASLTVSRSKTRRIRPQGFDFTIDELELAPSASTRVAFVTKAQTGAQRRTQDRIALSLFADGAVLLVADC